MRDLLRGISLAALLALAAPAAFAQNVPSGGSVLITPSYFSSVPMFWVGQGNGATACNAVSQTAANDTVTMTAPNTGSNYLTLFTMQLLEDATGFTQVGTISFTGVPTLGGTPPFLSQGTVLTTTQGPASTFVVPFNPPLKGLAGTAITAVPSATQNAHIIMCATAAGYQAL